MVLSDDDGGYAVADDLVVCRGSQKRLSRRCYVKYRDRGLLCLIQQLSHSNNHP